MRTPWIRIGGPVVALIAAELAAANWHGLAGLLGLAAAGGADAVRIAAQSVVWLAGALVTMRLLDVLVWKGVVLRQTGAPATRLLTDLVNGLILVSAMAAIIAFVFDKPVTGLIATSGVAVAVVGFALKSMISDLFSGIAITLERPFRMGDWVEISGGIIGRVLNISWRATGLMQQNGIYVVVPNGRLSEMVLKVYNRPEQTAWRDEISITLGYEVTTYQAERILRSAADDVAEIAALGRKADVRIAEFGDNGVKWRLRYWVPDYPSRSRLRYAVQRNILRNMHFSGVQTPVTKIDAQISRAEAPVSLHQGIEAFLARVSLFKMLGATEIAELAAQIDYRLVLAGTTLVRHGEDGASLFVIKEGLFEVLIPNGTGERSVAHLKSGAFFGEMSLLTGAQRSATVRARVDSVVFELTKDALQPILARREPLVEAMSAALAERQLQNDRSLAAAEDSSDGQVARQTLAGHLLGRMRNFFGLTGGTAG